MKEQRDLSKSWPVIIGLPVLLLVTGTFLTPMGQVMVQGVFGQPGNSARVASSQGELQIAALTYNDETGALDVQLRNTDTTDAVISKLTVYILADKVVHYSGELAASQGFVLPIMGLEVGREKSIDVNHFVTAKQADRIFIRLETLRELKLKLTITYNGDQTVSKETWINLPPE